MKERNIGEYIACRVEVAKDNKINFVDKVSSPKKSIKKVKKKR